MAVSFTFFTMLITLVPQVFLEIFRVRDRGSKPGSGDNESRL